MERRFVVFIILSFLVLTLNSFLAAPKQLPRKEPAAGDQLAQDDTPLDDGEKGAKDKGDGSLNHPDTDQELAASADPTLAGRDSEISSTADSNQTAAGANVGGANEAASPALSTDSPPSWPLEYVTLGSIDPESPYRMMVTFTSQGAAVRRVELASPRFRDLHNRSGYLGHLECVADEASGLRVRTK